MASTDKVPVPKDSETAVGMKKRDDTNPLSTRKTNPQPDREKNRTGNRKEAWHTMPTMQEIRNWNLIESRLNFEDVRQKLLNLSASGKLKRRKNASDLLDRVKDALLKARSDGVTITALAAFLSENGLPVSEPTLRNYLRAQGAINRRRHRKTVAVSKPSVQEPQPKPQPPALPEPKPETTTAQSLIDQRRVEAGPSTSYRRREGPRIADPKNV